MRRSLAPLLALLGTARSRGARPDPAYADAPPALQARFGALSPATDAGSTLAQHVGFVTWATLQGLIMLELFGHIAPVVGDPAPFYRHEVQIQLRRLGLRPAT